MSDTTPEAEPSEPSSGDVAATFCATLVDQWARGGVTDAVVSPGSRSTPITVALDRDPRIRLHVVHDERSAGFIALGLALESSRPAVVACTSGTAAVNLHPAVVEADLAAVPMLVVTADRPAELHGVLAPQTIDQHNLYGTSVRWYREPGPPARSGATWWRDLASDALERCRGTVPGPVHLNLAFREPLTGEPYGLPEPVSIPSGDGEPMPTLPDEELARMALHLSGRRGVIVAGVRSAASAQDAESLWGLADALGWPLLVDGPSGVGACRSAVITHFDSILRCEGFASENRPEAVLRFGGLLTSKVLNRWLAQSPVPQYAFDRHGRCPDPDRVNTRAFTVAPGVAADAIRSLAPDPAPTEWRDCWERAQRVAAEAIGLRLAHTGVATEPGVAVDVAAGVPSGGALVVSSSMPVRDMEGFAGARRDIAVYSNRGASGIDGVTATAIGVALSAGTPTVLLTGDVAFLHDSSSLTALATRPVDLVIVVIDNDGGGIFHFLAQADELDSERFERLWGTPHGTDLVALAAAHGLATQEVFSRAGLQATLAGALSRRGPRVVVVHTDRQANVGVHAKIHSAVARSLES